MAIVDPFRSPAAVPRVRLVRDVPGREWRVWAMDGTVVPGGRAGVCLVCDRGDLVRRVWDAPADWSTMDDDALRALVHAPVRSVPA